MASRKKGHRSKKRKRLKPKAFIVLLALGLICCLVALYFNSSSDSEDLGRTPIAEFDKSYEVDEHEGSQEGINRPGIRNRRVAENRSSVSSWPLKLLFSLFFFASVVLNIFLIWKGQMFQPKNSIGGDTGDFSGKGEKKQEPGTSFMNAPLSGEYDQLRSTNSKQQKEIKRLEEKVKRLEVQVEDFSQKKPSSKIVTAKTSYSSSLPTAPIEEPATPSNLQPVVVELFFEGPYDEAKFSVESGANERKFRYLYRIEYDNSDLKSGKLYLEPTQVELDILKNYSDNILKPACTYLNAFHSDLNGIIQLSPGRVIRQGDDWVVKEKVQIKFI